MRRDDWTDPRHPAHPMDGAVGRLLAAFAEVELATAPGSAARVRAAVLAEARVRLVAGAAPAGGPTLAALPSRAESGRVIALPRAGRLGRRLFAPLAAALLVVAVAGAAVAGSQPGGMLYGQRLWLEQATLPASGPGRITAEIGHLEARIVEVDSAVAAGDSGAAAAALDAYHDTLTDLTIATAADTDAAARLAGILARHLDVLNRVAAQLPPSAEAGMVRAIENAIDRARSAIDRVETGKPGGGGGNGNGPAGDGDGPANGGGNDGGQSGAGGSGGDSNAGGNGGGKGPSASHGPTESPSGGGASEKPGKGGGSGKDGG